MVHVKYAHKAIFTSALYAKQENIKKFRIPRIEHEKSARGPISGCRINNFEISTLYNFFVYEDILTRFVANGSPFDSL